MKTGRTVLATALPVAVAGWCLAAAGGTPPQPRSDRTYRIMPGDSLSQIAGRLLDSAARWRELYELNRDVLDDPDDLEPGTVIRLPGLK